MRALLEKLKSLPIVSRRYLGIMALGGTLILIWGAVFERHFHLRIPLYVPLAMLCYAGAFSIFLDVGPLRPDRLYLTLSLIALAHHIYLVELNDYHQYFLISTMLATSLATLSSTRLRHVAVTISLPLAYMTVGLLLHPDEKRALMFMAIASISAVILYVSYEKQVLSEKVKQDHALMEAHRIKSLESAKMAALGEMAAGIAHEINNPLAIISVKSEQLEDLVIAGRMDPALMKQGLNVIQTTVVRMVKIIRSLRALSRDVAADPLEPTSIRTIIDDTLNLCQVGFKDSRVQIIVDRGDQDCLVLCRGPQISQVLLNLLSNARDAVEALPVSSEKWVRISTEIHGGALVVRVTNSGESIPAELRSRIFDPFFTTKGAGKGTGLGLSICKSILESHRGYIRLDANEPHTTFEFGIPLVKEQSCL